ncbi:hypothetical protein PENTCL1PPCAC_30792 [Pristionchus entomophagus]|uniref:Uncharacterized protein n=1 Tax=Pristionchus entomophagus TaxID=358040 RepID=A0AAV5UR17_9BILA|nr:hypothetical protein PENTCL1PPCAC_30792 [Pristionchus entomophagus]
MGSVADCFEQCDPSFQKFRAQTSLSLTDCFAKNVNNAVDADECLFKGMKDFCRSDGERRFIRPANFSAAVGSPLQMAPTASEIPTCPCCKRALEQFNVFQDFFGCTKQCVHRQMTACFARKRCAVVIPPQETLKPIYEKCNAHTPQMSLSLLNTCQCLAHRKRVTSLYGICPIISNPLFIEN